MRIKKPDTAPLLSADKKSAPLNHHTTHTLAEIAEAEEFCRKQREALAQHSNSPEIPDSCPGKFPV
jgi:hypothetical protein